MNNFFVDLVSNASMKFYPDNTLAKFTNKLTPPLELDGEWEVAISEIFYPHKIEDPTYSLSMLFVDPLEGKIEKTIQCKNFVIPPNSKGEDIVKILNDCITREVENILKEVPEDLSWMGFPSFHISDEGKFVFKVGLADIFDGKSRIVSTFVYFHTEDPSFYKMLGFNDRSFLKKGQLPKETNRAENVYFPVSRSHLIFIYTDIIREHFVGDALSPVLRVVPLQQKDEMTMCNLSFPNLYYFKLKSNYIDTINILILDETGAKVRFGPGRVLINLHFRKCI